MDKFAAACRSKPELRGMVQTLFDRLLPRLKTDDTSDESLPALLERYGFDELAREVALKHLDLVAEVTKRTGTIWENYAPDAAEPGRHVTDRRWGSDAHGKNHEVEFLFPHLPLIIQIGNQEIFGPRIFPDL